MSPDQLQSMGIMNGHRKFSTLQLILSRQLVADLKAEASRRGVSTVHIGSHYRQRISPYRKRTARDLRCERFDVHGHRTIQPTEETRLPTREELYGGGG